MIVTLFFLFFCIIVSKYLFYSIIQQLIVGIISAFSPLNQFCFVRIIFIFLKWYFNLYFLFWIINIIIDFLIKKKNKEFGIYLIQLFVHYYFSKSSFFLKNNK